MTEYILQMQTLTGGLPWEYRFEMGSHEMAKGYVVKYIENGSLSIPYCRSVILWTTHDEFIAEWEFTTNVTAKEIHR